MTTEELKNKLKIAKNAGIYCPTLKLAKQVLNIFNDLGLKWCSDVSYIKCTNWDSHKENTVYYPFNGTLSSLKYAQQNDYKIISAQKFIALHTKAEEFNLENYEPKGQLEGFPKEIISRMLDCQEEQGNPRDVSIFESNKSYTLGAGGFDWDKTKEKDYFWHEVIVKKDFDLFFKKYPKKEDNSQKFKVGDKVIDIITGRKGKVISINTLNKDDAIFVDFNEDETTGYTLDGKYYSLDKYPRLLHHRDDYNYDIIDFNNLPQRQEYKRWRVEKGGIYYSFTFDFKVVDFCDTKRSLDNKAYNSGNYFKTEKEAQEVADKLNKYFQELIKRKGETYYCFTSNFEVEDFYDDDDIFDKKAYNLGNYFKTKEEAQEVAQKLNTYFKQLI